MLILGADPKIKDGKKKTAFEYANVSSHNFGEIEELFQLFQSNDSGKYNFFLCRIKNIDIIRLIFKLSFFMF